MQRLTVFSAFSLFLLAGFIVSAQESKPATLTQKQLRAELARQPVPADLAQKVVAAFGKQALAGGTARAKIEETTVAWAVQSGEPARVVKADGTLIGEMVRLGQDGIQALAVQLPNFSEFNYVIQAGGKKINEGAVRIEHYAYGPDSFPQPGVPKGVMHKFEFQSQIFTNTVRDVIVYVPAQYDGSKPAAVMVFQDGVRHADPNGQLRGPVVLDNLIHKREMPVTVGIFIDPGRRPNQKPGDRPANRGFEYDSLGNTYSRFLIEEILPEVTRRYGLKLSDDPMSRGIAGGSSGGICAWTVAWERPDQFGRVLSWVGSFVDLRGGHVYPYLIRKTERKPIKVYLLGGRNDLDNPFGNWPLANQMMAASLKYMGYDYHFEFGDCFHGSKHAGAILPDMLRWLWREK